MICSIEGCNKRAIRRGWCSAHYNRWLRHGDPFGGRHSHPISRLQWLELHQAYAGDDCLTWPYSRSSNGYCVVTLSDGSDAGAHRHMCILAHGEPPTPKHEAAHSCGNGSGGCLNPRHLQWETRTENEADKIVHGTHNRGSRHGNSKLSEAAVLEIRSLKGKKLQREIARNYDISRSLVGMIWQGKRWHWFEDNQNETPSLRASVGRRV